MAEEHFSPREIDSRFEAFQDQLDRRVSGLGDQINSRVSHLQELVEQRFRNLNQDGWTLSALREHLLELIGANERRYVELIEANKQQLIDADAANKQQLIDASMARETRFSELIEGNDKRYLEMLHAQREVASSALASSDRAVQKAEAAAEKRFESVNEFRSTLSDQQRNLMPRAEVDVTIKAMSDRMSGLEKQLDAMQAERMGIKGGWGYAVGVAGLVLALLSALGLFARIMGGGS